ncbi:MAG: hypothetical protein ACR2P4_02915 [Gammaproteobacteria bacterium]
MSGNKPNMRYQGEEWFRINRPELDGEDIRVSKCYIKQGRKVWWIDIPEWLVENSDGHTNLLCEIGEGIGKHFHHLRVPRAYFVENRALLDYREYGGRVRSRGYKYSLHLSASADNRFRDLRGAGRLDFSVFSYSPDGGEN